VTTEPHSDTKSLGRTQCSELLERICSSAELKRAGRLRDFLRYVGQRSLEADGVHISEHEVGVHVFDRRDGYDTGADNIVRVNASELRKRIATYYATEGAHESILLDIPLRSYTPQFSPRPVEPEPGAEQSAPDLHETEPASPASQAASKWMWVLRSLNAALILALAATCWYLFNQNRVARNQFYPWKSDPTLGPFWSGILDSPRQTDIVVADTSIALVEDILKKRITLSDYLNHDYIEQIQSSDLSPELKAELRKLALRGNGALGDFRVAQRILAFDPFSARTHLEFSRDYQPSAVKGDNVILIGSSRSNPWCSLFEDRLNFVVDYDLELHEMMVRNRHPRPGESAIYEVPVDLRNSSGLSVIDYLPNDDHTADVLIIAGTSSEATEAAGDFLTSEEPFQRFQNQLHVRTLPYFEVLLKTTRLAGTPLSAEVIAYRTLPGRLIGVH
jgi:hypothetical protein